MRRQAKWMLLFVALVSWVARADEGDVLSGREPGPRIYRGARVFRKGGFVEADLFVGGGVFLEREPAEPVEIVDLRGKYVMPPLAEAHTHRFAGAGDAEASRSLFLERGYLYAANLCGPRDARTGTAGAANGATGTPELARPAFGWWPTSIGRSTFGKRFGPVRIGSPTFRALP